MYVCFIAVFCLIALNLYKAFSRVSLSEIYYLVQNPFNVYVATFHKLLSLLNFFIIDQSFALICFSWTNSHKALANQSFLMRRLCKQSIKSIRKIRSSKEVTCRLHACFLNPLWFRNLEALSTSSLLAIPWQVCIYRHHSHPCASNSRAPIYKRAPRNSLAPPSFARAHSTISLSAQTRFVSPACVWVKARTRAKTQPCR